MNLHRYEHAAAYVALTLLMLCGVSVNNASAQRRAANRTHARANTRRMSPPAEADDRVISYLDEGQRHADAGDWAAALKAYIQATEIDSRDSEAHIYVGDAYMSLGKYKEAFAAYNEAVRVAPSNAEAHYSLGMAYNQMAMYGDAFKPLVKAISLDANYAEAHYGIGYAYLKLENFKEALVYLKGAVRLRNDFPEAHLSLGLTYLGLGQMESAEEQLKVLEGMDGVLARKLDKELRRIGGVAAVRPSPVARRSTDTDAEGLAVMPQPRKLEPEGETPPPTASRSPSATTHRAESDEAMPQPRSSQVAPAEQLPRGSASHLAAELTLWDRIKNSDDPEEFAAYLKKYPAGEFAGLARIRLRILESKRGGATRPGGERKQKAATTLTKTGDIVAPVAERAPKVSAEARRGTTIEETLRLLKEDFSNKLTYMATAPGQDANVVRVTSEVVIEYEPLRFDNCRIEWRDHKDMLSVVLADLDPLGVKVEPRSKPNTSFSIPIWNLTIKTVGGTPAIRALKGDGSGAVSHYNGLDMQFGNKEKAERLAWLLQQAIKLCAY
ncbi:MAG: tetratricopeptide repeat protein [Pyrinomonadaceae bacterium]